MENDTGTAATSSVGTDRSSLPVKLQMFSKDLLDWFTWIDQCHALVHLTNKESGEKLALLLSSFEGDAKIRIGGLGGGDVAYKQALSRLDVS